MVLGWKKITGSAKKNIMRFLGTTWRLLGQRRAPCPRPCSFTGEHLNFEDPIGRIIFQSGGFSGQQNSPMKLTKFRESRPSRTFRFWGFLQGRNSGITLQNS
eukprot:s1060_g11.t1